MTKKNIFYAQSGGVTAVINATAAGLITTARKHKNTLGKVYAGKNGILGALNEVLIDTSKESDKNIDALKYTPGGAFGSCRYKLKSIQENRAEYQRLIEVFKAHNIGYFFYNGGNDSQDTTHKIYQMSLEMNYPLTCIGIPKTVDNDLAITDNCPGFGSAAKYVATSIIEGTYDVRSMAATSTNVFIMEVMGRNAGWIAASAGLASQQDSDGPHIILAPEIAYDEIQFLKRVKQVVNEHGYCSIVVAEGIQNGQGQAISESVDTDAFGHHRLGGTAHIIANVISRNLSLKCHYAVCDYLQRSARHIASETDFKQAYALGEAAIKAALKKQTGIMLTIDRVSKKPYRWKIGQTNLANVANLEKKVPRDFFTKDGFHITQKCRDYLLPLIKGEAYVPYKNGIPKYINLKNQLIKKKLPNF
jgi:6-phosphofructokinase 1